MLLRHSQALRQDAKAKAIAMLDKVKIIDPEQRYWSYPFELSGGMCQRVMIAIALACDPRLLIADEPTTGLDVTTQKATMDLIRELTRERNMSVVLITHDLGMAAAYCDRIIVMQKGKVVESAPVRDLFTRPTHPYTKKLIAAVAGTAFEPGGPDRRARRDGRRGHGAGDGSAAAPASQRAGGRATCSR